SRRATPNPTTSISQPLTWLSLPIERPVGRTSGFTDGRQGRLPHGPSPWFSQGGGPPCPPTAGRDACPTEPRLSFPRGADLRVHRRPARTPAPRSLALVFPVGRASVPAGCRL